MKTGSSFFKFAVFVVVVFVCGTIVYNTLVTPIKGETTHRTALFNDVAGLHENSDVRMSGVQVGKVERVEPVVDGADPDNPEAAHAHVVFSLEKKYQLYRETKLAVRYQNLLGIRYLEIIPPDRAGGMHPLPHDAVIRLDQTISSFDVSTLFNGFKPIFQQVDPENLNKFTDDLLLLMQGDSTNIGDVLGEIKTLTLFAVSRDELFKTLFDELSKITEVLSGKSKMVLDLLNQFGNAFGALADQSAQLSNMVGMTLRAEHSLLPLLSELEAAYDELYGPVDAFLFRVLPELGPIANMFAIAPELIPAPYDTAQVGTDHAPRLASVIIGGNEDQQPAANPELCKPKTITSPVGTVILAGEVRDCA